MEVNERIVIEIPEGMRGNRRRRPYWIKRNIAKAVIEMRNRIVEATGMDIFNLYVMDDCIEISLKGELEAKPFEKVKVKKAPPLRVRGRLKTLSYDSGSRRVRKQR